MKFLFLKSIYLFFVISVFTVDAGDIHLIQIKDYIINPIVSEFISESVDRANEESAECLIIEMDTPGGLLNSTREIVKKLLNSPVPIIVFVSPSGSRAASAGVFITLSSHIAVMAPGTNIGAAHPVNIGGGGFKKKPAEYIKKWFQPEELEEKNQSDSPIEAEETDQLSDENYNPMEDKVMNDTLAWVRSICKTRERDPQWPLKSVIESVSITAEEASELKVIDFLAKDLNDLIQQIDGYKIQIPSSEKILSLKNKSIKTFTLSTRQKILNAIAHPNIAYIFMILGFYGLLFEITHPGVGFPGVAGLICLTLAFFSFQALPISYAGLFLIILAFGLIVAEFMTAGVGLLALGGGVSLVLGSILLFDSSMPFLTVSLSILLPVLLATFALIGVLFFVIMKTKNKKPVSGMESMLGKSAIVRKTIFLEKKGKVFLMGEIWDAISDDEIIQGEEVVIVKTNGLCLIVEKKKEES